MKNKLKNTIKITIKNKQLPYYDPTINTDEMDLFIEREKEYYTYDHFQIRGITITEKQEKEIIGYIDDYYFCWDTWTREYNNDYRQVMFNKFIEHNSELGQVIKETDLGGDNSVIFYIDPFFLRMLAKKYNTISDEIDYNLGHELEKLITFFTEEYITDGIEESVSEGEFNFEMQELEHERYLNSIAYPDGLHAYLDNLGKVV